MFSTVRVADALVFAFFTIPELMHFEVLAALETGTTPY
jgi:hypothetical protein